MQEKGFMDITLKSANLALAFLLELGILAALAYWGVRTGDGLGMQIVLGLGAPLLVAVVWGLWLAPRARRRLPNGPRLVLKLVIFGVAALALAAAGQPGLAGGFALLAVINTVLLYVWRQ